MWCPQCQADVATDMAVDGQSLRCAHCGEEIRKVFAPTLHPTVQTARELLERWAAEDLLDDPAPPASQPPELAPQSLADREPARTDRVSAPATPVLGADDPDADSGTHRAAPPNPRLRVDSSHPVSRFHESGAARPRTIPGETPERDENTPERRHDHGHRLAAPHFDVQSTIEPRTSAGRGESLWGQMLAYAGVGVLTIGTVLVLWGHFGGEANYSSTGWLVATGGQMLLFLGVVTLVSGGMQQTTHEVTARVERIGERIIRIEQSTQDLLRGPHTNLSNSRSTADADRRGVHRDQDS